MYAQVVKKGIKMNIVTKTEMKYENGKFLRIETIIGDVDVVTEAGWLDYEYHHPYWVVVTEMKITREFTEFVMAYGWGEDVPPLAGSGAACKQCLSDGSVEDSHFACDVPSKRSPLMALYNAGMIESTYLTDGWVWEVSCGLSDGEIAEREMFLRMEEDELRQN